MDSTALAVANIIAIMASAVIAVAITLWWQARKEKRDAKIRLFTTLMAFRKAYPVNYEWARALNLIDVIFSDSPEVVARWHRYFDNLEDKNPAALNRRIHIYLELMSEMAKELGFPNLQQTDIDKFYVPQSHADQADINAKIQNEWLRVLKNTARFETSSRGTQEAQESALPEFPLPQSNQKQLDLPPPK